MMQATESRELNHRPTTRRANSFFWSFFVQPKVRSVAVVIEDILREEAFQVKLVEGNDVVQQITAATFDPPLGDSVLPRAFERSCDGRQTLSFAKTLSSFRI